MAIKTLSLLLAVGGIAAAFYRAGQRSVHTGASSSALTGSSAGLDEASRAPLGSATAATNPGERLQDLKLANAGLGSSANEDNEDLLAPPRGEDQQAENIKPGLPDFARGA